MLALYRSAAQPEMANLGQKLHRASRRPGLALIADHDRGSGDDVHRRRAAARAGAKIANLSGLGHWWMLEDPYQAAQVLRSFWSTRPRSPMIIGRAWSPPG